MHILTVSGDIKCIIGYAENRPEKAIIINRILIKIFIEFWKAKDAWHQLSKKERSSFVAQIGPVMEDLVSKGVVIDAWGINDDSSPHKANYDFFAITKLPSQELLENFQAIVEGSGWYNYFEQINVTGEDIGAEKLIGKMIDL